MTSSETENDKNIITPPTHSEESNDSDKRPEPFSGRTMLADAGEISTPPEEIKTRKEHEHLARQTSNKMSDMGFLTLLFAFFLGVDKKTLAKDGTAEQLSDAFGLDQDEFKQTVNNVISGKTTAFSATAKTIKNYNPANVDWNKANNIEMSSIIGQSTNGTLLHPNLVDRMSTDPKVAQMVQWTLDAAKREGIDANLLANQYWAESNFDPNAGSGKGARGIAQFIPEHLGKWGLETKADFLDPKKSIDAGAKFMAHLTNRTGNQYLAMVAYNGGEGAIRYAEKNINESEVTIGNWMNFMHQERQEKGVGADNLWRNETFNYIKRIDPTYWDKNLIARAESQSINQIAFNNGGVVVADSKQPDPLTPKFGQGGVDETVLVTERDAQIAAASADGIKPSAHVPT